MKTTIKNNNNNDNKEEKQLPKLPFANKFLFSSNKLSNLTKDTKQQNRSSHPTFTEPFLNLKDETDKKTSSSRSISESKENIVECNPSEKNMKQQDQCSQLTFAETISNPKYAFFYQQIDDIVFSPRPMFESKENTVDSSSDNYVPNKIKKMLIETFQENINGNSEENGDKIRAMNHNALENRTNANNKKGYPLTRKNAMRNISAIIKP